MIETNSFLSELETHKVISSELKQAMQSQISDIQNKIDILYKIIQCLGDDEVEVNQMIEKLKQKQNRKKFIPYFHLVIITRKLSEIFGENYNTSECSQIIYKFVRQNYPDLTKILQNIYKQFQGDDLVDSIQQIKQQLVDLKQIFQQLHSYEKNIDNASTNPDLLNSRKTEQDNYSQQSKLKQCQEYIQTLKRDLKQMPQSIIQHKFLKAQLQIEEIYLQTKQYPQVYEALPETKKLLQQLENNKLISNDGEDKKALNEIKNNNDCRENVRILKRIICGININQILRMLAKGRQIGELQQKNKQNNKKMRVIMFIGLSKAGKTTIMTRLMGYQMEQTRIQGIFTVQPKYPKLIKQQHKQLVIGHRNSSTTLYPRFYEIQLEEQDEEFITYGMDCAGFQDSSGVQIEIPNRITTIEALKKVDELQIVIVINQKNWGVRGEDIEKLAKTVSGIIMSYKKIKPSITFAFNQFDEKTKISLYNNVQNLFEQIKKKSQSVIDENFKQFFTHLKASTKKPQQMFIVDPIKMKPQQFIMKVSKSKNKIDNPTTVLISDIGIKARQQIKKFCLRCKKQFYKCYQNSNLQGAQYYLYMLQKIGSQPKLESSATLQIQNMKISIQTELEKKIQLLNHEFEQLQNIIIRDNDQRKKNLQLLKNKCNQLKNDVMRFLKIKKDSKLIQKIQQIINETSRWYIKQMQKWNNQKYVGLNDLGVITNSAILFHQNFDSLDGKALNKILQGSLTTLKQKMQKIFVDLNEGHEMQRNYEKYSQLFIILNEGQPNQFLRKQIQETLYKLQKQATLFNLDKIENYKDLNQLIKASNYEENDINNVQKLLKYIKVTLTYPNQMIEKIKTKMNMIGQNIMKNIPQKMIGQYQYLLKSLKRSDQTQIQQIQIQIDKNKQNQGKQKGKIQNSIKILHNLIKNLKLIIKISPIKMIYQQKLSQKFIQISEIIQQQMRNFETIKLAFRQNNANNLKSDIRRMTHQFRGLQNMIKVIDNMQVSKRFEDLKLDLKDSITTFINANQISQFTNFNSQSLKDTYLKYLKLIQFKEIHKIFGDQQLRQKMEKIINNAQNKIINPLQIYQKQLNSRKTLQVNKFCSYNKYLEQLKSYCMEKLSGDTNTKIEKLQTKIRQQLKEIYKTIIQEPLFQLIKILNQSQNLQENNITSVEVYFKQKNSEKSRKAVTLLFELLDLSDRSNSVQAYFGNIQDLKSQLKNEFQDFKANLDNKISFSSTQINILDKLKIITFKLKNIQSAFPQSKGDFQKLNQQIRSKMKNLAQDDQKKIDNINKQYFDEETFTQCFLKCSKDKSQAGIKNKQKLNEIFRQYKNKVKNQLIALNSKNQDDQHQGKKMQEILKAITDYYKKVIFIKFKFQRQFNLNVDIQYIEQILNQFDQKIKSFLNIIQNKIITDKQSQIKKLKSNINKIDEYLQYIKSYLEPTDKQKYLGKIQKVKKQYEIKSFIDYVKKKQSNKNQQIQKIKNNNKLIYQLNEQFKLLYNSFEQKEQKQIQFKLLNSFNLELQSLHKLYVQNCQEYEIQKNTLLDKIKYLPINICQNYKSKLFTVQKKIKQIQINKIKQKIEMQKIDFMNVIKLAKTYHQGKNKDELSFIRQILKNQIVKYDDLKFQQQLKVLKNQLWKNKSQFMNISQILPQFQKIQSKSCQKIKSKILKLWKQLFGKYIDEQQSGDSHSQIFVYQKKNYNNEFELIIQIYEYIKSALQSKIFIKPQNFTLCQEIRQNIKLNLTQYIQRCKKQVQKFQQIVNQFLNANKINMYQIQNIFKLIIIYEEDLNQLIRKKSQGLKNQKATAQNLLNTMNNLKLNLNNKVIQIIQYKFLVITNQIKNSSKQSLQKKTIIYQNMLSNLQTLSNQKYNQYIAPSKKIQMQQIYKKIQIQTQNLKNQFQSALKITFQSPMIEKIEVKINLIPKFFNIIATQSKGYFHGFDKLCEKFKNQIQSLYYKELAKSDQLVTQLKKTFTQTSKNYKDYRIKQQQKYQNKKQTLINKLNSDLKIIQNKYKQLKQNVSNQDQKQRNQIILKQTAQIKDLQNLNRKNIEMLDEQKQKLLNNFLKGQINQKQRCIEQISKQLILLKKIQQIQEISKDVTKGINSQLSKLQKIKQAHKRLFVILSESNSYLASLLIDDHQAFEKLKSKQFQQLTKQTNSIDYVLSTMLKKGTITNDQSDNLKIYFGKFDTQQKKYIQNYKRTKDRNIISQLINKINNDSQNIKNMLSQKDKQNQQFINSNTRVELLAKIFALWSLSSSQTDEIAQNDDEQQVMIINEAHAAQVACILIILSLDQHMDNQAIKLNRLAEVKTGQGKSIVLAILSIYFALFGFEVHCACYSSVLSKRDQQAFDKLFQYCGVKNKIRYGIFQEIIKKILNQQKQQNKQQQKLQKIIEQLLLSNNQQSMFSKALQWFKSFKLFQNLMKKNGKSDTKMILIIDQIDVLFDKNYFGDTFNQSIDLRDEKIVQLFEYIWKNRQQITKQKILQSNEYTNLITKFKSIQKILQNQINGMCLALQTYKDQNYVIIDKKIMYKVQDSLVDVSYRYNTVYAYCAEFQKNKVSRQAYLNHLTINLCVAQFSYACLPQYYDYVVGVTGTLTCLPDHIKQYLDKNYKIYKKQMYQIPSVYGVNKQNRIICEPISVPKTQHYKQIVKNIKQQFDKQRPIFVFFRNKSELFHFFCCQQFSQLQNFAMCITQQNNQFERNQRIKNSSCKNSITLMTNSFIRGTDFKLLNKIAIQKGGFHAIIAYLIQSIADYIQATGRVARQGKPGSVVQIFCEEEFQLLNIDRDDPAKLKKINEARKNLQSKQKDSCEQKLKLSSQRHNETLNVFNSEKFDQSSLIEYVLKKNYFPNFSSNSTKARLILAIDGTISMGDLFTQLKIILPNIFDDVYETLKNKKFSGSLQMQIVIYRNYNSNIDSLLEYSPFSNQGDTLKLFINNTSVSGGWKNQAVEVCLQHVNKLENINQVILIGDAAGNTKQQVQFKRKHFPILQQERLAQDFTLTTTEEQLQKIINKKIKIHGFYLLDNKNISEYFNKLSIQTNGKSQYINIRSKQASNIITTFIVQRALNLIGGEKSAKALLDEYKKLLSKRMGR